MFRKYAAMAAGMMLAATAAPALGEDQQAIPTQTVVCTTFGCQIATHGHSGATFTEAVPTSEPISEKNARTFAVQSPQQGLAGASASGWVLPGHDYTTQTLSAQEQKMLNLLNFDRKNNGLAALTHDPELSRIARIKSQDMRDKGYFAHESPTYGDVRAMLRTFGYEYRGASENIAHHANVDKAQAAFLSSPGHRANILSKVWTKVGVGIVFDRDGFIYATQIFAR